MGQRHQIFMRVLNPVNTITYATKEEKKVMRSAFGRNKYTILAIYHGWLYGRSAIVNLMNMLDISNIKSDTLNEYNNPFTDKFYGDLEKWKQSVKTLIQAQLNPLHPRGIGIESSWVLNYDEPEMRSYFDIGDNNDGVTIIDTINRRYCFLNISDSLKYYDKEDFPLNSVGDLPFMKPVTAMEYMKAYYPENTNDFSSWNKKEHSVEELKSMAKENRIDNEELNNELAKRNVKLLTERQIIRMFPKMELIAEK